MKEPTQIVNKMYQNDAFSQWLGIEIIDIKSGGCTLQMTVNPEMLNGFHIAHGGITYSLSDSAFAFASNSTGKKALSIETSIAHIQKVESGDILKAIARKVHASKKLGRYEVLTYNQNNDLVARFYGTVYITSVEW